MSPHKGKQRKGTDADDEFISMEMLIVVKDSQTRFGNMEVRMTSMETRPIVSPAAMAARETPGALIIMSIQML